MKPHATRHTLYLSMLPSTFCLSQKTHLHLMMFLPGGHGTVAHILVCLSKPILRSITPSQQGQSKQDHTSCTDFRSPSTSWMVVAISSSYPTRLAHSDRSSLSFT